MCENEIEADRMVSKYDSYNRFFQYPSSYSLGCALITNQLVSQDKQLYI